MDTTLGVILVIVGLVLLLVEASEPGFFLAIPAGVLILLGILAIIYPAILLTIWTPLIVAVVVLPLVFGQMKFYQKISPPTKPTTTMSSSLEGRVGKVLHTVKPDEISGKVKISNEIWSATSESVIAEGSKVVVVKSRGVHVVVEEIEK